MNKSILVIDTPNNCNECEFYTDYDDCKILGQFVKILNPISTVHPQCPLQDTTELLGALETLTKNGIKLSEWTAYRLLYEALGGKQ